MKVFFWGLVAIACCYGAYGAMMSAYQWFQIHSVIDEVAQPRNLRELATPADVQQRIVRDATAAGVPLDARAVHVAANKGALAIRVAWKFPMIVYQGESLFAIPLSVTKSLPADAGRAQRPGDAARASAMSFCTRARSSALGATCTNRSHDRTAPATSFLAS
jgi:hypothetical protein